MKSKLLILLFITILGVFPVSSLYAQGDENEAAPEILTTDLVRRQQVESSQLEVSFVIYDDDAITDVIINGESQSFEPATTLNIEKMLNFVEGKNIITVKAIDVNGNERTKNYLVAYGVDLASLEEEQPTADKAEDEGFKWKIVGGIQLNSDSNPSNDLSLPIAIEDFEITGQIDDAEQTDTQTAINLMGIFSYGKIGGLVGYAQGTYSKDIYETLNSAVMIAGVSYVPKPNEDGFDGRYTLMDIKLGSEAYAQYHIFKVGYQFGRSDKEDGTTRHLWGLLYNHKIFDDSALDTGNITLFRWEYTNLDADNLDFFKSVIAFGSGSDGTEKTEYSGFAIDFDWSNQWESGFMQGIGMGLHYKTFPNDEPLISDLGDSRTDLPIRLSFSLGWAFTPNWSLQYKYDYKVNISTKKPSQRIINGLQLKGGF